MAARRKKKLAPSITDEFDGLRLGDARLERRARMLAAALAAHPTATLPSACSSEAEVEGMYRFLGNERVTRVALLDPHRRETLARAAHAKRVLAIHDTTTFEAWAAAPDEVGYLNTGKAGFFGHLTMLVDRRDAMPLGIVGTELWSRAQPPGERGQGRRRDRIVRPLAARESERWERGVAAVETDADDFDVLHVMDREGDIYRLLSSMGETGRRFVIRHARSRPARRGARGRESTTTELIKTAKCVAERTVELSRRAESESPRAKLTHPPRERRTTTLRISAMSMILAPPSRQRALGELPINVVRVHEANAKQKDAPVEWVLFTNEPIETAEQIAEVVDAYRTRWLIEELFKAIKSGCAYERRELGTETALHNLLGLVIPIAWRILMLRALERRDDASSADAVLTPMQLKLLMRLRPNISAKSNAGDVVRALASLGGHLKTNGPPGWLTIYRGFRKLLQLEEGAVLYAGITSEM